MSNSLDPDHSSGLIWVQTVYQCYQQMTLEDKELMPDTVHCISIFKCISTNLNESLFLSKSKVSEGGAQIASSCKKND